jgi:hypothetical protein
MRSNESVERKEPARDSEHGSPRIKEEKPLIGSQLDEFDA